LCAREVVGDEPFVVLLPDDIIAADPPVAKQMLDVFEKYGEGVVAVMEVPDEEVSRYGIVDGEKWNPGLHRVRMLVEKPDQAVAPSNLAVIGRYVLPAGIFEYLTEVERDDSGEIQLTDALARLARDRALVGYEFSGVRHDIGDRLGYLTANISYALERPELRDRLRDFMERTLAGEVSLG
jgi:UTP--glucose-1-phosphate uridylyltransferase